MTYTIVEFNGATGEQIERAMTSEEAAAYEAAIAAQEAEDQARIDASEAAAAARQSALEKLATLGLTQEEAAAIVGNSAP